MSSQEAYPQADTWTQTGSHTYEFQTDLTLDPDAPFWAYSLLYPDQHVNSNIGVSFSADGIHWTSPQRIEADHHATRTDRNVSQLYSTEPSFNYVKILLTFPQNLEDFTLRLVNPGHSMPQISEPSNQRDCPAPEFQTRDQWCPAGDCPPHPNPAATTPTHFIVHHSASSNVSSDWAATVRTIWDFHVNTNGWADVGYNWLVDPEGTVYEGRGSNVIGAHFCGANGQTEGICVIGNFTIVVPQLEARAALTHLLGWRTGDLDYVSTNVATHSSSGLDLQRVSGHRDGCATACPGNFFYNTFDALRDEVEDWKETNCVFVPNILPPEALTAAALSANSAELNWTDASDNELGFFIERSADTPQDYVAVDTVPANTTQWTDTGLDSDRVYYYRIRGVNFSDQSPYSNEAEVTTLFSSTQSPSAPSDWMLAPVPARQFIQVTLPEDQTGTFTVLDLMGRTRIEQTGVQGSERIDLSGLPAGTYFMRGRVGTRKQIQKFIKLSD